MRLWRLTRAPWVALDGKGAERHGTRYAPSGAPLVNFASEAGLAVLVALRYLPPDRSAIADDYVLGWTDVDATPLRAPTATEDETRSWVARWLEQRASLLAAVTSRVLPEADVVLMNPLHPAAAQVAPLACRPFDFAQCLHTPPMLARYESQP